MADSIPETRSESFSIGRVFSRAFGTIAANPLAAVGIALLFGALPTMAYEYANARLFQPGAQPSLRLAGLWLIAVGLGVSVVATVFATLVQGAFVRLTIAHEEGRRPRFAEAGTTGVSMLVPLLGLGLVLALGTMIGFMMLVVPGIFMLLMWAVASPVLVEKRCGIRAALRESTILAEGMWGSILGVILIVVVIEATAAYLLPLLLQDHWDSAFLVVAGQPFPILHLTVQLMTDMITATLSGAVYTSLYVELRNWKQGTPQDALIEIFA